MASVKNLKKDINYTFLSLAITFWKFRNRYFLTRNGLELFIPITGSGFPYKSYTLALLNQHVFAWPEKLLIKLSYSFTTKNLFDADDVNNIVNVLFNNIDNAITKNNQRAFSGSVDNLQLFMREMFSVTFFINDNKKIDNWLLLSDNSLFSRTLLDEFMKEYYSLNSMIIEKTLDTDYYFRKFCYFYQYCFTPDASTHNEIQKSLLQAHYYLWVELIKNDALKAKPYFDGLCKKYIGGWESWSHREEKNIDTWDNASFSISNLTNHMQFSCRQIIVSTRYENDQASLWAINILNNWSRNYNLDRGSNQYLWKTEILSSSIFKDNEDKDIVKYITNDAINITDLYKISLRNDLVQSKIITASYILNKDVRDIDRQIIFALLNGDKISPSSTPKMAFKHNAIHIILETYILNDSSFWQITKNRVAQVLIKDFNTIYEDEKITGRVYSGIGRDGVSSMKDSFLVLLISNSTSSFNLSKNIYDFIFSDLFPQQNREDLIRTLNEFVIVNDKVKEKVKRLFVCKIFH